MARMARLKRPLDEIFDRYRVSRRDVCEVLGLSEQAVTHWACGIRTITAERAVELEKRLQIPRWEVRPDLWPNPNPPPVTSKKPVPVVAAVSTPASRRRRPRSPGPSAG